jgi:hypothetical protein
MALVQVHADGLAADVERGRKALMTALRYVDDVLENDGAQVAALIELAKVLEDLDCAIEDLRENGERPVQLHIVNGENDTDDAGS